MKRMNGRRRGQQRGEQGAGNTTVEGIRGPRRIVFSSIPSSRLFHLLPLWALLFLGKSSGFIAFITITTLKQFITSPLPTAPLHLPQHLATLSFYFRFWRDPFDFSLAWQHEFQPLVKFRTTLLYLFSSPFLYRSFKPWFYYFLHHHWTLNVCRLLVRTKTDLLSNQQFGVSTVSLCHSRGLMGSPIVMIFSLNTPCRYAKQVVCKNM